MFLVMVNDSDGILNELVLVTDRDKAQKHFLDTCSTKLSNWDEYTPADKDALLDLGYEKFGGGIVMLINTDGFTSDDAIRDELTKQPAGEVKVAEVIEAGELDLKPGMTVDEIIEACGRNLDAACSWEIQGGGILFKGDDDRWYTITTESIIEEAPPDFVKDTLAFPCKIG